MTAQLPGSRAQGLDLSTETAVQAWMERWIVQFWSSGAGLEH